MASSTTIERVAESELVSERIVAAVAEEIGSDQGTLEPLYEAVDPDALDTLYEPRRRGVTPSRVTFRYCECDVVVSDDGTGPRVEVTDRTRRRPE